MWQQLHSFISANDLTLLLHLKVDCRQSNESIREGYDKQMDNTRYFVMSVEKES